MGAWGPGMPRYLLLQEFGDKVWCAFGEIPYLVGSALKTTDYRDIDVRLILDDDRYAAEGYGDPNYQHNNEKWCAMVLAFSALGKQMTGLPIDFQIQQRTHANKTFDGDRSALGMVPWRFKKDNDTSAILTNQGET